MKYSIIIPYHSNRALLHICLHTLLQTIEGDTEIIIVANNYNPDELNIDVPPGCTILKLNETVFYPRAVNLGVQASCGEFVVLMDADVGVRAGWLDALSAIFEQHTDAGGCSAKMLDPFDGSVKEFGIGFTGYNFPHPFAGRSENDRLVCQDREVQAFCSAASMYRRSTFLELGGMNEGLIDGYSDIDFCLRLHAHGLRTFVAANSVVYHHSSSTLGSGMSRQLRADTKGYFMAHGGQYCKIDMDKYFCVAFREKESWLKSQYFLIDFTTIANRQWHYKLFEGVGGFTLTGIYCAPPKHRDTPHIPLYTQLNDNIRRRPQPLCYFVDDFRSLRENRMWFELRNCADDLVIDRNANVFLLREIECSREG